MSNDLPPYGSYARSHSVNPHAVTPSEQSASASERDGQEAPARSRLMEIIAELNARPAGRGRGGHER